MSAILGCHVTGNTEAAEALLKRSLGLIRGPYRLHSFVHSDNQSQITTFIVQAGGHAHLVKDERGLQVSLSAAGLPSQADIWVAAENGSLQLGRNLFGRATLFCLKQQDVIWFSSQLQLLLPVMEQKDISLPALYGYSCFSWVPAPLTPVTGILALPAGSTEAFTFLPSGGIEHRSARSSVTNGLLALHDETGDSGTEAEAIARLRELLEQAGTEQLSDLAADEPVGVFLSGGLDSSIVAALLVRAGLKVRAFALDFGAYGFSELSFAESVAQHLNIPLLRVDASPRRIRRAIGAAVRALDLPFGDGVTVPLYLLCEAASREVGTIFNGEGSDQLFAGWTNKPLIASGVYTREHPAGDDFEQAYLRTFHRLHGYENRVFSPQVATELVQLNPRDWLADALAHERELPLLHRLRRAGLLLKGAQNIQPRATNLALAHGLNLRTPFCSLPLTQWALSTRDDWWLRGSCEKYLLKRAVTDWLPSEIVWREKRGMGVPLTSWCLGPLWHELGRWLRPDTLRAEGIFQPDLALRIATGRFSGHVQGRRIGELLWLLLAWQVWRRVMLPDKHTVADDFRQLLARLYWLPPRMWQWRYQA